MYVYQVLINFSCLDQFSSTPLQVFRYYHSFCDFYILLVKPHISVKFLEYVVHQQESQEFGKG